MESFSSSGVGKAPDMKEVRTSLLLVHSITGSCCLPQILKTITTRDEEIQQLAATGQSNQLCALACPHYNALPTSPTTHLSLLMAKLLLLVEGFPKCWPHFSDPGMATVEGILNVQAVVALYRARCCPLIATSIPAVDMCSCQREMASVEEELEQRSKEVAQLQKNLQEAERIIVSNAVYTLNEGHLSRMDSSSCVTRNCTEYSIRVTCYQGDY